MRMRSDLAIHAINVCNGIDAKTEAFVPCNTGHIRTFKIKQIILNKGNCHLCTNALLCYCIYMINKFIVKAIVN